MTWQCVQLYRKSVTQNDKCSPLRQNKCKTIFLATHAFSCLDLPNIYLVHFLSSLQPSSSSHISLAFSFFCLHRSFLIACAPFLFPLLNSLPPPPSLPPSLSRYSPLIPATLSNLPQFFSLHIPSLLPYFPPALLFPPVPPPFSP